MNCPKCQSEEDSVVISESFPCCDCGGANLIEYHMCPICTAMWRTFNGIFTDNSLTELGSLANAVMTIEGDDNLFKNVREDIDKQFRLHNGDAKMTDFVHYCLRCSALAFPSGPRTFKCSSCEFEWEVIAVE
jgi:hypothetical protein